MVDVSEDKLTLTTCIRCHDDAVTFAEYLVNDLELLGGTDVRYHTSVGLDLSYHKLERFGEHRQILVRSLTVSVCRWHGEGNEVSQCPGYKITVACHVAILLLCCTDDAGDVLTYARLFCYNCYHNILGIKEAVSRPDYGAGNGCQVSNGIVLLRGVDTDDFEQRRVVLAYKLQSGIHHHIYTEEYEAQRYDTCLLASEQCLKLTCLFEFILEDTDT